MRKLYQRLSKFFHQKQIQQAVKKCDIMIDKHINKHLLNIKPRAPKLNALIKIHKENEPVRLVVNNVQAPSYKITKYLNKRLNNLINLPNTYTVKNSYEIVQELNNIQVNKHNRMITLDIKDLYVNLPVKNILQVHKFWLNKHYNNNTITEQTLYLLKVILKQNYIQYNNQFFQPEKAIAMGSPISSTIAEIYLQFLEEKYKKQWLENKGIIYCKRYIDDILIIFYQNKTDEKTILNHMNNIDKHLEFKLSEEENNTINYLDLSIHRNTNSIDLGIYRKPTRTDVTIQFSSNHPLEHKLPAFNFYINRMITLPITKQAKQQEWKIILAVAQNNGFPLHIIHNLKKKLIVKKQKLPTTTQQAKKWVTFSYHSPLIRKITNLFKHSNLNIALHA